MSDIIHLLPDVVANQIAAGEVVQRPSSVVKELMENAIDAGAHTIQVRIVDAGKTEIQVVDDGKGMSDTDARLAFERHATSKIQSAADLYAIHTMGFRGEALASVAAVAQVELKTKQPETELGTHLFIEGAKLQSQEPTACPNGTNFIVRNIFYNVPARRKFLKANTTELNKILVEFERIAMFYKDLHFELYNGSERLFALPPSSFKQRVENLFGRRIGQSLIPIEAQTEIVKIKGFVTVPESAKKKNPHQFFYVNGRYMRHPYFNKAVQSAYERLIPENEQVQYFIQLEVDPAKIDVNVHPTKTEIKFADEASIWQILLASVKEALGRFNAIPTIDFDRENCPEIPIFNQQEAMPDPPSVSVDHRFDPFVMEKHASRASAQQWQAAFAPRTEKLTEMPQTATDEHNTLYDSQEASTAVDWKTGAQVVFQYRGRFIVTLTDYGILLVDQQRAHFRILYERYLAQLKAHKGFSQKLLFPELVQFPLSQVAVLHKIMEQLTVLGFDLSDLGNGSFSVNGIPDGTEGVSPQELIESLLDSAMHKASDLKDEMASRIAQGIAQKAAMPVGQVLTETEMRSLLADLYSTSNPHYAPNGKPILYLTTVSQIEKAFS